MFASDARPCLYLSVHLIVFPGRRNSKFIGLVGNAAEIRVLFLD